MILKKKSNATSSTKATMAISLPIRSTGIRRARSSYRGLGAKTRRRSRSIVKRVRVIRIRRTSHQTIDDVRKDVAQVRMKMETMALTTLRTMAKVQLTTTPKKKRAKKATTLKTSMQSIVPTRSASSSTTSS